MRITAARRLPPCRYSSVTWGVTPVKFRVLAAAMGVCLLSLHIAGVGLAQPPGTPPPLAPSTELPVKAFLFLDESGNPVMMPGISYEEIERLKNLEAGINAPSQPYVFQSLDISGSTDGGRAELDVVLRLSIGSTDGRTIAIPLRMRNFHALAPADVSGIDEFDMAVAPDESGYLLFVKSDKPRDALLKMSVAARVEANVTRSLEFQLPDVPSTVRLRTDSVNMSGEVVGRGDEVIKPPQKTADGRTELIVESSGGTFTLRWGRLEEGTNSSQMLEVDNSRINVRWDSPQDQPIASVQLVIRNVRGSVSTFDIRMPKDSVLLDTPTLGANGQPVETSGQDGNRLQVTIPEDERDPRIDLNFDLQLANNDATSASPLVFQIPEVVGALRRRGEIRFETGGDYRLRWRARPWIRSVFAEASEDAVSKRSYLFRYDRGAVDLPVWLSAKERRLRLTSESEVSLLESIASLETTIRATGQTVDGRGLRMDLAAWRLRSIRDLETGNEVESFRSGQYLEIPLNSAGDGEPAPIKILAERSIDPQQSPLSFTLPRIIETDESLLVQSDLLSIRSTGRASLVIDLAKSTGLDRIVSSDTTSDPTISRFRILPGDTPAQVVGAMVEQPTRIMLASDGTIDLDGNQLRTTVDWTVTSRLDLEGRLKVRIPSERADPGLPDEDFGDAGIAAKENAGQAESANGVVQSEPWVVTVNDRPATLVPLGDDLYELISDNLTDGTMAIRWRHSQTIQANAAGDSIESVAMPRPTIADVTVRGMIRFALIGNQQIDVTSAQSRGMSVIQFDTMPRDPVRLSLRSRLTTEEDLSVRRAVLLTAVSHNMRHEQVLATIQGGDTFQVGLPAEISQVAVEALVDQRPSKVHRDGDTLVVSLPGDKSNHSIDLRVWIAENTPSSIATVEPLLRLPVGVGRVFWQIVVPQDAHVVWASPTLGRAMRWRFDDWRLYREPTQSERTLTTWAGGAELTPLPLGNRYLYVGSDVRSFQLVIASRGVLWLLMGSLVLLAATILTYVPKTRHPLTAVGGAVIFAGVLVIAPDAAVLAGQLGMIALVLVIVMIAIRSLIVPRGGSRVLSPVASPKRAAATTRGVQERPSDRSSITQTRSLVENPSEVSP